MNRLDPSPNEGLRLAGRGYIFEPHPAAPWTVYAAEGRKAVVYRLRDTDDDRFAFKVFKESYRGEHLLGIPRILRRLWGLEGLKIARRSVVDPSSQLAQRFPETAFAALMPWIDGHTWSDLLVQAGRGEGHLDLATSLSLGTRFLSVLCALEKRSAAHTDIASGNVVLSLETETVELLDIEDAYLPDRRPPRHRPRGSPGYQHPSLQQGGDCWRPEGDRYAAAVFTAEILLLANPEIATFASEDGLFQEDHNWLFDRMLAWLNRVAPEYRKVFSKAWSAPKLEDCPTVKELHSALQVAAEGSPTRVGAAWIKSEVPRQQATSISNSPVVEWTPIFVSWQAPPSASTPSTPPPSSRPFTATHQPQPPKQGSVGYQPVFLIVALVLSLMLWSTSGEPAWLSLSMVGAVIDYIRMTIRNRSP